MSTRPVHVLELRSVRGTGGGPEKTIFAGALRADPRFHVTVCYIRDRRDETFALDQLASRLGVDYVEVYERHSFDPSIWRQLRRLVCDRRIDIIHAHEYKTDLLSLLLARSTDTIPLSTVHGWTGNAWRERLLYYPADRRILRQFPALIAVSGQIRDRLVRAGADPARITTVLNGIDSKKFCRQPDRCLRSRALFAIPPSAIVLGSVGRLERQKRFDLLIHAVADLRRTGADIRLLLAGDGSLRQLLERTAIDLGVRDACIFAGHQPDVANAFHAMDLFVQSSDYEGTSNAVLEAMAFEVPIVATAAGGTAEQIADGIHGVIIAPGDAALLADGIRRTLDAPDTAARRATAARRRVEHELSFEARVRAVENVYDRLVTERQAGRLEGKVA